MSVDRNIEKSSEAMEAAEESCVNAPTGDEGSGKSDAPDETKLAACQTEVNAPTGDEDNGKSDAPNETKLAACQTEVNVPTGDKGSDKLDAPGDAKLDADQSKKTQNYHGDVYGATGDNTKVIFNFGKVQERFDGILHRSDAIPPHSPYANEAEVLSFAKVLVEQNLLLVTHPICAREKVQSALYSLLEYLRVTHTHLRRFTSSSPKPLDLRLFMDAEKSWKKSYEDSIVYLDLRDHPPNLTFEFTEGLCRELREARCHLVLVSTRVPNNQQHLNETLHARANITSWHIEPENTVSTTIGNLQLNLAEPVGQTLTFVASMVPGLTAVSFLRLCERLLPPPETIRSQETISPTDGGWTAKQAGTTPLERWYAGEHDVLLSNAGVKLASSNDDFSGGLKGGAKGFYVENCDISIMAKAKLFSEAPLFLVGKFDLMTSLYFEESWPDAFSEGYIDFAYRLHVSGLNLLSAEWLVEKFAKIESGNDPDHGLIQFTRLVYRLADLPNGLELISDFYYLLAKQISDDETEWHRKLAKTPLTSLAATVASCPATVEFENRDVPETALCVIQFRDEHGLDDDFFLLLSRARFRFVSILHIGEMLNDSASALIGLQYSLVGPESRQRMYSSVGDLPDICALISPVYGAFLQAANVLVHELPERFLALTNGVLELLPAWGEPLWSRTGTSGRSDKNSDYERPPSSVAAEIASDAFLESFEQFLATHLTEGLPDGFVDSVLAPDKGRRCGQIVFAMMNKRKPRKQSERLLQNARQFPLESWQAIRMTEWMCRGLLMRKGEKESSVLPYAIGFGSQIRLQVDLPRLSEIIDDAHQYKFDFNQRAERFRRLGRYEDEVRELKRARLVAMVIRGLTTRIAVPNGDRKV